MLGTAIPHTQRLPGAAEQRGHPPEWSSLPGEESGGRQERAAPRRAGPRGAARALRALCPPGLPLPPPPPAGERWEKPLPEGWGLRWRLAMWMLASAKGSGGILGAGDLGTE